MHIAAREVKEQELLRLLMCGYSMKECGVHVGLTYKTIRDYARSAVFLAKLKEMSCNVYERVDAELKNSKDTINARLEEFSEEALEEMFMMAKRLPDGMVKLKALQDIEDRDPRISRQKRVEGTTAVSFVDPLFLVHASATARELEAKKIGEGGTSTEGGSDHANG